MTDERVTLKKVGAKNIGFAVLLTVIFYVLVCAMSYLVYFRTDEQSDFSDAVAFFALILIICVIFAVYVYCTEKTLFIERRKLAATYAVMTVSLAIAFIFSVFIPLDYGMYCAPFALCALITALLISPKCSFFANFIVTIIFFMNEMRFAGDSVRIYYPLLVGIMTGIVGSYSISSCERRIQYIMTGAVLGFISVGIAVASNVLFVKTDVIPSDMLVICLFSLISGAVNIGFFMLFVPIFESVFNIVSDSRLAEIASTNRPLMKRLRKEAVGTFNHSILLASYAEACASAIGDDVFLARAAGYYHDIGKLSAPKYFSENQLDGENPHDTLSPEASVRIIKTHVTKGLALAKEYHLPVEIQKVIEEHHGTLPLMFFYHRASRITEGGAVDKSSYSYDGPKPSSRISAIIMICDACEAALRANNDRDKAEQIVDGIVSQRFESGQFSDCDITMKQLNIIKDTIITTYIGIEHKRVKYPDQKMGNGNAFSSEGKDAAAERK